MIFSQSESNISADSRVQWDEDVGMGSKDIGTAEATKWDPGFTEQINKWVGPVDKRYFGAEVHGLDSVPAAGGA